MRIHIVSPSGGSGATTLAVAIALVAKIDRIEIVTDDIAAVADVGVPEADAISLSVPSSEAELEIFDRKHRTPNGGFVVLALRGPSYPAVSAAQRWLNERSRMGFELNLVAVLDEPGRALQKRDVEAVFQTPVIETQLDVTVARSIDAGLFAHRLPASYADYAKHVLALATAHDLQGVSK